MKLSLVLASGASLSLASAFPLAGFFENLQFSFSYYDEDRTVLISDIPRTIKESQKFELLKNGVKFMDITDHPHLLDTTDVNIPVYSYPKKPHFEKQVKELTSQVNKTNLYDNLEALSSFRSRYYKSETGLKSAQWLFHKLEHIISEADESLNVTVSKFEHSWIQFSTIVRIPGSEDPENIVVVGSHQDSANLLLPTILPAPGADDDGSGVTTNLEALRILVKSGFRPKNTIEFHFYSAEEGGLLGSLDIFANYKAHNKTVLGMLQQDMTGFVQRTLDDGKQEHVGVITDYVSPEFTEFIKVVIDSYLSIPWVETKCGYACSDHASAMKHGYPSSFIIESEFKYSNPHIHSVGDTLDKLSFDHIAEFTKLVLGYSYELGYHDFGL